MSHPDWTDDERDGPLIASNVAALLAEFTVGGRTLPDADELRRWHTRLYQGVRTPVAGYLGHFRGDPEVTELLEFDVGVGDLLPDGLPEKVGLWAEAVDGAVARLLDTLHASFIDLDARLPVGARPTVADDLVEVIELAARAHGEWVRIHPYVNGNGRTARLWVAFTCLRYQLPTIVAVRPRPDSDAYARASQRSMGRPPDFSGDHGPTVALFARLLVEQLRALEK